MSNTSINAMSLDDFAYFDIETTGLYPSKGANITELALLRNNQALYYKTNEKTSFKKVLKYLMTEINQKIIVGHNLMFDLKFITYLANRLKVKGPEILFIDTLRLARKLLPHLSDHRLDSLIEKLAIEVKGPLHSAIVDVHATRTLFWTLLSIGNMKTLNEAGIQRISWQNF